MTTEEFKEITRAVVLALREELTPGNKEVLDKLSAVENKLKYDGNNLGVDISAEPNNNLCQKTDGLYASNSYVTTESSPVGEIIAFMGTIAPEHYLSCDGTEYTIGTYPLLEQFFVTQFGSVNYFGGDGTTTFAVPDLRGEFLRGTGTNSKQATTNTFGSGESVGIHQEATRHPYIGLHDGSMWFDDTIEGMSSTAKIVQVPMQWDKRLALKNNDTGRGLKIPHTNATYTTSGTSGYTSRPTNTSVMYCIKYEPTQFHGDLNSVRGNISSDYSGNTIAYIVNEYMGMIVIQGLQNLTENKTITIATLPQIAIPSVLVLQDVESPEGAKVRFTISNDGKITCYLYNNINPNNLNCTIVYAK